MQPILSYENYIVDRALLLQDKGEGRGNYFYSKDTWTPSLIIFYVETKVLQFNHYIYNRN